MLEVVELDVVAAHPPQQVEEEENNNNNHHPDDEALSLLSGLTNHTRENNQNQQPSIMILAALASPYGKMLNAMKASATLKRRESLGRAALSISAIILLVLLMGWFLWIIIIQVANHHHHHHPRQRPSPTPPPPVHRIPDVGTTGTPQVVYTSYPLPPISSPSSTPLLTNNNDSTTTATTITPVDIIVQMSGELGNHLSKLASGVGISLYLRELGIPSNLRLRHPDHTDKWKNPVQYLKSCFPFARDLNFSEAQSLSTTMMMMKQQQQMSSPNLFQRYDGINNNNETIIRTTIQQIADDASHNNNNSNNHSSIISVYSNHLSLLDAYMDRYYDIYREYFAMDESCCGLLPAQDEIVLHMRLFTKEMPHKGVMKGYEELSPKDLVEQALQFSPFNHTSAPKKIALLSRYTDQLDDYVSTLEKAGWTVRVIVNQTTTQDFCFLRHAKVLLGSVRSTFFWWAAVLSSNDDEDDDTNDVGRTTNKSTAVSVVAYSMDSPAKQQWAISHNTSVLETYPFRNPAIRAKFQFPLYKATNDDI